MTDIAKNNGALLAAGERLKNEREQQLREIADLKNAKEELRGVVEKIGICLNLTWVHPQEVQSAVESLNAKYKNRTDERNNLEETLRKIFRMVKGVGSSSAPDDVIDAVYKFAQKVSGTTTADISNQLEAEAAANADLRKELEIEKERCKQARENAASFREEARIAMQTAQHWKTQVGTTELALRRAEEAAKDSKYKKLYDETIKMHNKVLAERDALERECTRHQRDNAAHASAGAQNASRVMALNEQIAELQARLRKPTPKQGDDLRALVLKALRDALEQVKRGGAQHRAPKAYDKAFNNGLIAGASIVETEIYSCLPPEK